MKSNRRNPFLAAFVSLTFAAPSLHAAALSWDGLDTVTSGAQGGTGTWNANTTPNWWDGSADVVWPNSGADNDAIFGGTAGTVSVLSVTANELLFNTTGYFLSGASTLTLNGTTPTITTGSGIVATVGDLTDTVLAGADGLTKAGAGTLAVNGSAVNTFTGGVTIKGGTLALNLNNLGTPTNLINNGNSLGLYQGGVLGITGKDAAASAQTFNGTSIHSGNSTLTLTPGAGASITGTYGTVTQTEAGGVVSFANATSATRIINVSNPVSSFIGSWAYVGDHKTNAGRYASVNASGQVLSITGIAATPGTMANVTSATIVYTASGSFTATGALAAFGVQSNAASTWALGGFPLTTNGILGISNTLAITGTAGVVAGAGNDLVVAGAGAVTISVPIHNNASSNSHLTYAGGGSLTLQNSASSYTGKTTVNSGKIVVSTGGSINTSNGITVNGGTFVQNNTATAITPVVTVQGGTVDGTGTINTVNVSDLATNKITNGNATTTALTVGNLTFSGDAAIDIRTAGSAGLAVSGTLTPTSANGTVTVNVTSAPIWAIGSTYNLISYGALAGSLADFTKGTIAGLGGRQTADLVTNGNNLAVSIGGDKALWTGAASSDWTTGAVASPFNWKTQLGAAGTDFLINDDVVFDDTALSTSVIIADATVSPNTTTFNNNTKSYTLSGGGIATGTFAKNGTNTVSLTNSNTYTGTTTINGGTLQASGGSAIANTGLITLANAAGATFQVVGSETIGALSGGGATGGAVSIDASQTLTLSSGTQTYAGMISGAGTLASAGALQTLGGALSHSGGINVTTGVLTLGNSSNSFTGTTLLNSSVTTGAGILVTANGALGAIGEGNGTTIIGVPVSPAVTTSQLGFSGSINYSMAEKITGSGVGGAANVGAFIATQRGFIQSVSGNNTFAGDIELSADGLSRIGTQDGAQLTLTGAITQAAGITTANILFRAGSTAGDFVTLSNPGNSFGGNSQIFTGAAAGNYAGVRLGITNALPTNLTIVAFTGSLAGTALDLAGHDQSLNGLTTNGSGILNIINMNTVTPSKLTLTPTVDKSSPTLILGGGGLGVINVVKDGAFTQTLSGANTYTGSTTVSGGTLALGAGNVLPDTAVSIGNATLDAAIFTDTLGTLEVTSTAKINLGSAAAALAFAPASPAWTGTLTITGTFVSGASLKFGNDANGLTLAQLSLISSPGFTGFGLDSGGFLTATSVGGYSAWQSANLTNGGIDEDHDADGVSNGIEYFLGGTTNTTGFTPLPPVVKALDGTLSVTWTRAATYPGTAIYGTDFVVQTSATLANPWTPQTLGGTVTITGPNSEFVIYTFPAGTKNFARLKVTGP